MIRARKRLGLTQAQLASKIRVGQSTISKVEAGDEHVPRGDTLARLCDALGLSPNELLAESDEPLAATGTEGQ
jgi:transcriptional regulator with XRE-family HTH domain